MKLPADVAIVTNIDPEHLDHFKTFDAIKDAFRSFIENLPFYGFAVMCLDHPTVQQLVGQIEDRRVITYGENPQADFRLIDIDLSGGQSKFTLLVRDRKKNRDEVIRDLVMPMPGHHNALNATAAIAVAYDLGVPVERIREALAGFGGVKRRFTKTGEWNGVQIFDDYGHHPVEIAAVLRAARAHQGAGAGHRHRPAASLHSAVALFDDFASCFNDADRVLVADTIAAGEAPIAGADKEHLAAGIRARGHRNVSAIDGPEAIAPVIREHAKAGDYVVFLGAGNITQWAYALPGELAG